MKKFLNIGLTLVFLGIFLIYFILKKDDFKILLDVKYYYIIIIALLQIAVVLVNGIFFVVIQEGLALKISQREGFLVSIISSIGNYFTPFRGGMGIRAVYLKKRHNFPYSKFFSTLAGNYIIVFMINSLIALVSIALLALDNHNIDYKLVSIFVFIFLALLFISIAPVPTKSLTQINYKIFNSFAKKFISVIEGWNIIIKNKNLMVKLIILTLLNALLGIGIYFFELRAVGLNTNLLYVTVFSSISSISLLLSLTPGSLGIRESLLVLFQSSLALSTSQILSSSVVDRVIYFFVMILLALSLKLLGYNFKNEKNPNPEKVK